MLDLKKKKKKGRLKKTSGFLQEALLEQVKHLGQTESPVEKCFQLPHPDTLLDESLMG